MKKSSLMILLLGIILATPVALLAEDSWSKLSGAVDYVSSSVGMGPVSSRLSSVYTNNIAKPLASNTQIRSLYSIAGGIPGIGSTLQGTMSASYKIATNPAGSFNSAISSANGLASSCVTGVSGLSSGLTATAVAAVTPYTDYMLKHNPISYAYDAGGKVVGGLQYQKPTKIGNYTGY
jgi:hypothetical protein